MKAFIKKAIVILSVAALAASLALSGCSGKSANVGGGTADKDTSSKTVAPEPGSDSNLTAAGEYPIVKEKITLKIVTSDETYVGPLKDVDFTKWYEEKTNIHIEWVEIPSETMKDKCNLMLTTGDLPDVFLYSPFSTSDIARYGSEGVFANIKDYIEPLGANLKEMIKKYEGVEGMMTAPDGNIYSMPKFNDCLHCQYKQKIWINQDWLTNLNLQMPTTTAEFETVLQAFKDKDPNKNGKADEIPAMGATGANSNYDISAFLMNSFIYFDDLGPNAYMHLDNSKIVFAPDKDKFKEGLTYINGLVSKGLIDPTSYTQPIEQYQKVTQDPEAVKVGVIKSFNLPGVVGGYANTEDHRITQYVGVAPFKGPDGYAVEPSNTYTERIDTTSYIITTACENAEAAFRWADGWYTQEASMMAWYGKEGVGWTKPEDGSLGLNGKPALYNRIIIPDEKGDQTRSMGNLLGDNSAELREGQAVDPNDPNHVYGTENVLYQATKNIFKPAAKPEMTVPPLTLLPEESVEIASVITQVNDYVKENFALFCLGTKSVQKDWDSYIAEFEKLGLSRLLEVYQTAYDRQYK